MREAADGAEHFLHRRGFADDFGLRQRGGFRLRTAPLARVRNSPLGYRDHLIQIEGLRQVFKSTLLVGGDRAVQIGMRRSDDNRQFRELFTDACKQGESIGARHANIADDHVGLFACDVAEQLVGVCKAFVGNAGLTQRAFEYPADRAVVVCYPDFSVPLHVLIPLAGKLKKWFRRRCCHN